jgi:hypothetical protein
MIINIWKPIYKGSKQNRQVTRYEKVDFVDRKGYIIIYSCDICEKISKTNSSSLLNTSYSFNTIQKQTCRCCRSRISEYEIKKTQIHFSEILNSIASENYTLKTSEKEYNSSFRKSQMKLNVVCNIGHDYTVSWNNWSKGKRCRTCYEKNKKSNAVKYKYGFFLYHFLVWKETNKNFKEYQNLINPNNLKRTSKLHLDHIYSIYDGFQNNVPTYIISSIQNLRLVSSARNISKGKKSEITLDELCIKIFTEK